MASKSHTNFWSWASDHWFLTFLLASTAMSSVVALVRGPSDPWPALNKKDPNE